MNAQNFIIELDKYSDKNRALALQKYFKTDIGEYGEGDIFIGVRVPDTRKVCKKFKNLQLPEVKKLLESKIHEHRLAAVLILCDQYKKSNKLVRQHIYDLYLYELYNNKINNWDIIDSSAGRIVGTHNQQSNRKILYQLSKSENIWERRVAVISTSVYIVNGDATTTIDLAKILLNDPHDLIHKAVGWMLREIGSKIDEKILTDFLEEYSANMPRVMLRYACEKLPKDQRYYFYQKFKSR